MGAAGIAPCQPRPAPYLHAMENSPTTRVLYNDTCPICAHEIGIYARAAQQGAGPDMQFCPLSDAASFGLDSDTAAQQLHVMQGGTLLVGVDAFIAIWAALPRWAWAARLASLPVIRTALGFVYSRIAAPILYQSHLRRKRKAQGK